MTEIVCIEIEKLSPKELQQFQSLIDKSLWPALKGQDPWGVQSAKIFAVAALKKKKPIGLALATFRPFVQDARLLGVFIQREFRQQDLQIQLIQAIESLLLECGCCQISFIFKQSLPSSPALALTLKQLLWTTPQLFIIRCHFLVQEFSPQWYRRSYTFPNEYTLFPWHEISSEEKQQLHFQMDQGRFSPSVSPFHDEATIEPINSLGLRKGKDVIGWMITNRVAEDTIQYASLYIDREYYFSGYAIYMLIASIHLQQASKVAKSLFELNLEEADYKWIKFIRNRLIPHCSHVERLYQSYHLLLTPSDEETSILEI